MYRLTEGSETSKYLKEKKSKEIPRVAASGRGLVQTTLMKKAAVVVSVVFRIFYNLLCRVGKRK